MLAEFLGKLTELIDARNVPRTLDIDRRDGTRVCLGGKIELLPPEPPPRLDHALDLLAFAEMVGGSESPRVYHGGNLVEGVLDATPTSDRRDRVRWHLTDSEKWGALIAGRERRGHAEFVRFLREKLRDELEAAHAGLLGLLESIKFRSIDEQAGTVTRGRESIDKDVDAELMGIDKLPDTVKLEVRRWAEVAEVTVVVECDLFVDPVDRRLALVPLADELALAGIAAHDLLGGLLTAALGEDVPVYHAVNLDDED